MDAKRVSPSKGCVRSPWTMAAPHERTDNKPSPSVAAARADISQNTSTICPSYIHYGDNDVLPVAKSVSAVIKTDAKSCVVSPSSNRKTPLPVNMPMSVMSPTSFDFGHKYAQTATAITRIATPATAAVGGVALMGKGCQKDGLKNEATPHNASGVRLSPMATEVRPHAQVMAPFTASRLPQRAICTGARAKETEKSCPGSNNMSNVSLRTGCEEYTPLSSSLLVSAQSLESDWNIDCTAQPCDIQTYNPVAASEENGSHTAESNKHYLLSSEQALYTVSSAADLPQYRPVLEKGHASTRKLSFPVRTPASHAAATANSHTTRGDSSHMSALKSHLHTAPTVTTVRRQDSVTAPHLAISSSYWRAKPWTTQDEMQSCRELLRTLSNKWCYTAQENQNAYAKGGYLSVAPGTVVYSRYIFVKKLGWGEFSTVWLAFDTRRYTQTRTIAQQQQQHQQQQILHQQKHHRLLDALDAFVAIKISRCGSSDIVNAQYEISLLIYLSSVLRSNSPITQLLHNFDIIGNYGRHPCMVMPVHGANLLCIVDYMKAHQRQRTVNEVRLIKRIILTVLQGLADLAAASVLHTDIKPENILCSSPDDTTMRTMIEFCRNRANRNAFVDQRCSYDNCVGEATPYCSVDYYTDFASSITPHNKKPGKAIGQPGGTCDAKENYQHSAFAQSSRVPNESDHIVRIADVGLSILLMPPSSLSIARTDSNIPPQCMHLLRERNGVVVRTPGVLTNTHGIRLQTREYRAPEVLLGLDFTPTTDVWSVGCMTYELITGHFLMDPKRVAQNEDQIDLEHITMIIQLLGPLPPKITQRALAPSSRRNADDTTTSTAKAALPSCHVPVHLHKYVDSSGQLIPRKTYYDANERRQLHQELLPYFATEQEGREAAKFILQCLHSYDPRDRFSATDLTLHSWMQGNK